MGRDTFQNDEYYHIFNRGNNKRDIFLDRNDYIRFLTGMREFNKTNPIGSLRLLESSKKYENSGPTAVATAVGPLLDILCYCLNKNHYHLVLRQIKTGGVSEFMKRLNGGYTCYFNIKHKNSGSLFQGRFKAIHIESEAQLQRVSCYVNGNAEIHKLVKAENYQWSSYPDYLNKRDGTLCDKNIILKYFKNIEEYKDLTNYIIKESIGEKEEVKKYSLE